MDAGRIAALIDAYAEGPHLLERALAGIPEDELRFTPGPEHWSIHENVMHVVENDLVYAVRLRYLLAEPAKIPVSFDGSHWSRTLGYHAQPLREALVLFRASRESAAALLRTLPQDAWDRSGAHWEQDAGSGLKTITVAQAVALFADHLHYHLRTITKRRAQYAGSKR